MFSWKQTTNSLNYESMDLCSQGIIKHKNYLNIIWDNMGYIDIIK